LALQKGSEKSNATRWFNSACQIAEMNISHFEEAEKWNEMSKWAWFLDKLKKARARRHDQLFEMNPPIPERHADS
jgi:hypothetical protein